MVITRRAFINGIRIFLGVVGILALIILSVAVDDVWDGSTWLVGSVLVIGIMIGGYIATRIEFQDDKHGAGEE